MSESNSKDKKKLRIGFIHPDLGIGELAFPPLGTAFAWRTQQDAERDVLASPGANLDRRGREAGCRRGGVLAAQGSRCGDVHLAT
jgi:hypothetical protein